jgi:hypothetical protein
MEGAANVLREKLRATNTKVSPPVGWMWVWRPATAKRATVLQIRTKGLRTLKGFFDTSYVTKTKLCWSLVSQACVLGKYIDTNRMEWSYKILGPELQLARGRADIMHWRWGQMCTGECPDVRGVTEDIEAENNNKKVCWKIRWTSW